jgi:hypothetical protein
MPFASTWESTSIYIYIYVCICTPSLPHKERVSYRACRSVVGLTADKGPEVDAKLFDFVVRQDLAISASFFDLELRVHVLVDVSQPFDAAPRPARGWSGQHQHGGTVKLCWGRCSREEAPVFDICADCELERPQKKTARKRAFGAGPPLVAITPSRIGRAKFPKHLWWKLAVRASLAVLHDQGRRRPPRCHGPCGISHQCEDVQKFAAIFLRSQPPVAVRKAFRRDRPI